MLKNKKEVIYVLLGIVSFVMLIVLNITEDYVSFERYQQLHQYDEIIEEQLERDTNIYRFNNMIEPIDTSNVIYHPRYYNGTIYSSTYNVDYYQFYHQILQMNNDTYNHLMLIDTNNVIRDRLFGIKYVLTSSKLGEGYKLLEQGDDYFLYENLLALPLGYATNNIYSQKQFSNLKYPETLDMLLMGIVVDNPNVINAYNSNVTKLDL